MTIVILKREMLSQAKLGTFNKGRAFSGYWNTLKALITLNNK